ncbi:MAG: hypothetical protein H6Q20_959 [Bacteroidetes bacterium]|nr:hypothetical protein [Bacteroidota bacterium]
MKYKGLIQLIITTILMSLILVFIVVSIKNLVNEKNKIYSALVISQQNRDILLKTEKVTESFFLVEVSYKEYCTTFKKKDLEKYNERIENLNQSIINLQKSINSNDGNKERFMHIFGEKNKESEIYVKLRSLTDSLIFSTANLDKKHHSLERYIEKISEIKVDTLSVTKTVETKKKGIFSKLKTFVAGEKTKESTSTKVVINSSEELAGVVPGISKSQELDSKIKNLNKKEGDNMPALIKNALEMKKSELKLIEINNKLIRELESILVNIKKNIWKDEMKQNSNFLKSVSRSTSQIQSILYILVMLAFILVIYIIYLAYRIYKFQKNIVVLNEQITKDSIEKDKFYSILSHDLMNPFNLLLGFSSMLHESVEEDNKDEVKEYTNIIQQSTKQIHHLLQSLLTWSRLQNGKIEFSPQLTNVSDFMLECNMILNPIAENKNIELQWQVENDIQANFDKNMIGSVIQNLVTNAIKFTERGGSVKVESHIKSKQLYIIVTDTGTGMSEDKANQLFRLDKNNSNKGTENESGSGLGLIICKEFIENHKGSINVVSTVGQGTKITVTLPVSLKKTK